jgi:hypothetical protein
VKSDLFILVGIQSPGRVNLFHFGTVNLSELDDDTLLRIFRSGRCPYLKPTEAGLKVLYPEQKPITIKANPVVETRFITSQNPVTESNPEPVVTEQSRGAEGSKGQSTDPPKRKPRKKPSTPKN